MDAEFALNNVKTALMRIHVSGEDAGLLAGAIENVSLVLQAIKEAKEWEKNEKKKEAEADDH